MSTTLMSDVTNQIQKFWAPMFKDLLLEDNHLAKLVDTSYAGELKQGGDTVHVSAISRPSASRKVVGAGDDSFSSSALTTTRISIQANQVITASFDIQNLVDLQSQIGAQKSAIRDRLIEACNISLNSYLYSLVAPSAASPDHSLTSVTDFNATQLGIVRRLAAAAKWPKDDKWCLLLDPSYFSDFLNSTTLMSSDYVGDRASESGQLGVKRFGFNVIEDNSAGLVALGTSGVDCGLAFHPDFLHLVMQQQPEFKISDLHPLGIHGYKVSVSMVAGAALGIEGSVKHISVINS